MTSTPRHVVVIGAGKMGAHHARVFDACGVFDIDAGAATRVANAGGSKVFTSFDDAIDHAELVVIATPTGLHFEQAKEALMARRHVLVEKPLAATAAEAQALCEIARERGVKLFVGHSERFNSALLDVASACAGESIVSITTRRTAAAEADDLCLNLAVHDVDLVALLAGAPATFVSATGDRNAAEILLRVGSATATVHVSRAIERVRSIHVQTTRNLHEADLTQRGDAEPLALQAEATLAALDGAVSTIAMGEDGLRAVALAETASARIAESRTFAAE